MLHVHFGAGRLGLGLIAPFVQKPGSELHLLNRAVSGVNATGSTVLSPSRRNELLRDHPERHYFIRKPAVSDSDRQVVRYDGFFPSEQGDVPEVVRTIARRSTRKEAGVVVTASILDATSYGPVVEALNTLGGMKENGDAIGGISLIA